MKYNININFNAEKFDNDVNKELDGIKFDDIVIENQYIKVFSDKKVFMFKLRDYIEINTNKHVEK